ncbi:MAG: hypothetical protein KDD66_02445 [Bdellovibrionales bacterium]|nr:hypothetical protein [Bdellovibrionales bacterium]
MDQQSKTSAVAESYKKSFVWLFQSEWIQIPAALALYPVIHAVYASGASVREHIYLTDIVSLSAFSDPEFPICLLAMLAPLLLFRRRLNWSEFDSFGAARLAVGLLALLAAWSFALADYNYYYNFAHSVDRLALLGMAVLVFVHPVFLPTLILWTLLMVHQADYPLGVAETADKRLLFQLLILTNTCLLVKIFTPVRSRTLLFLLSAMTAANYYYPGLLKAELSPNQHEWLYENQLANLAAAAYANGWFSWMDEQTVLSLLSRVSDWNFVLTLGTLLIEIGSIAWWTSRRLFVVGGLLHIALHTGIAVFSGVIFWKWALINIILMITVEIATREDKLFSPLHFVAFGAVVYFSPHYFNPVRLGWFDSPLSNYYKFYAVSPDGKEFEIPNTFFAPYDIFFQQSKFYYLGGNPLVGTYGGVRSYDFVKQLETLDSAAAVETMKAGRTARPIDENRKAALGEFVNRYMTNFIYEGGSEPQWWQNLSFLRPPYHIYSSPRGPAFDGSQKVQSVVVRYIETLYLKSEIINVKQEDVMSIDMSHTLEQSQD